MSDKITVEHGGHIEKIGFTPSEPGWFNYAWGYYFGGHLWDGSSKITANDPGNVRAFDTAFVRRHANLDRLLNNFFIKHHG